MRPLGGTVDINHPLILCFRLKNTISQFGTLFSRVSQVAPVYQGQHDKLSIICVCLFCIYDKNKKFVLKSLFVTISKYNTNNIMA